MPKLRPRPDLPAMPPPPLKKRKVSQEPQEIVVVDQDSKTSRLLTKSECGRGGGGRKKTTGSLIHSIPKFTQVRTKNLWKVHHWRWSLQVAPKDGQISEVQKVLQSRLLSKQLSRQSCSTTTPLVERKDHHKSKAEATAKAEFPASSMLQSIVSLHERVSQGKIFTPKPLPIINSSSRKRVRKPDKSSICHVLKQSQDEPEVIIHEEPEVTITPTTLKPEEYRQLGMPKGFIFWPMANVFVHPSVLKQLSNEQKQPTNSSQVLPTLRMLLRMPFNPFLLRSVFASSSSRGVPSLRWRRRKWCRLIPMATSATTRATTPTYRAPWRHCHVKWWPPTPAILSPIALPRWLPTNWAVFPKISNDLFLQH